MFKGNFIDNLPKIYGLYTGGFFIFVILMAILEQAGVSASTIGILFVAFTIVITELQTLLIAITVPILILTPFIISRRILKSQNNTS